MMVIFRVYSLEMQEFCFLYTFIDAFVCGEITLSSISVE